MRKILSRIGAGFLGAVMTGASLLVPAMAADLADYPAPFVTDGTTDMLIVVGADALPADVVGAVNIAVRLGAEPGETKTCTATGTETTTVGGGVLIESPGEDFNYNEDVIDIVSSFGSSDLATILADETYEDTEGNNDNEVDYSQDLAFQANTATIVFDIDESTGNEPAGTYLFVDEDTKVYAFTIDFSEDVEVDNAADMEDTELVIQGKTYTISNVVMDAAGDDVDKIELLGGAAEQPIKDGESVTFKNIAGTDYTLTPDIYEDEVRFTVEYGGSSESTDALEEGSTYTLDDGTEIGVRDILYSAKESKPSSVIVYVGAQKVVLEDGKEAEVNDEDIEGSLVTLTNDDSDTIDTIKIEYTPEDEVWVAEDGEWVDPVFGAWKLVFTGLTKETEEFKWDSTDGDEAVFTFTNNDGKEVEMLVGIDTVSDEVAWGDPNEYHFWDNDGTADANGEGSNNAGMALTDGDLCAVVNGTGLTDECDDFLFLGISSGGEAHVFKVEDLSVANDEIKLKDLTLDTDLENGDWIDCSVAIDTDIGDITIDCGQDDADELDFEDIDLTAGNTGDVKTSMGAVLNFAEDAANGEADVTVEDADAAQDLITFDDDGSDEIVIDIDAGIDMMDALEDSDKEVGIDAAGWGIVYTNADTTEDTQLTAEYPEEKVIANVWLAPTAAKVTTTGGEETSTYEQVVPVTTDIAKLDTDVATPLGLNAILVGGPCVNDLVATLAEGDKFPYTCDTWPGEDFGLIKIIDDAFGDGKVALVVAGTRADDTRAACNALQQYVTQDLSGEAVKVTGIPSDFEVAPFEEAVEPEGNNTE